jgi:hypothetical protein
MIKAKGKRKKEKGKTKTKTQHSKTQNAGMDARFSVFIFAFCLLPFAFGAL